MANCPKIAEGDVVRITRVDSCGNPDAGADNGFVDDCWASVLMAPNVQQGTDVDFTSFNGRSCGYKRGCPTFRGFDITGQFFSASPEMVEILTGNPVYLDYNGDPIGWDDESVACTAGFALEVWQNVVGEDCPTEGDGLWFYWLLPWLTNGMLGDVTVNQEGVNFTITANTRANSNWSLGPYDVQAQDAGNTAGPLLEPIGSGAHRRGFLTTITPPTAACDYIVVPANNIAPS